MLGLPVEPMATEAIPAPWRPDVKPMLMAPAIASSERRPRQARWRPPSGKGGEAKRCGEVAVGISGGANCNGVCTVGVCLAVGCVEHAYWSSSPELHPAIAGETWTNKATAKKATNLHKGARHAGWLVRLLRSRTDMGTPVHEDADGREKPDLSAFNPPPEGPVKVQLNWINGKALNWHYRGEIAGGHFKRKT